MAYLAKEPGSPPARASFGPAAPHRARRRTATRNRQEGGPGGDSRVGPSRSWRCVKAWMTNLRTIHGSGNSRERPLTAPLRRSAPIPASATRAKRSIMSDITAPMPGIPHSFAQSPVLILQEMRREGPVGAFEAWRARRHYRRELRRLLAVGPHMIADIGLTLDEAQNEMVRPFWRP